MNNHTIRIFVTGITGELGAYMSKAFLANPNIIITANYRNEKKRQELDSKLTAKERARVKFFPGDLSGNKKEIAEKSKEVLGACPDYIVNIAGLFKWDDELWRLDEEHIRMPRPLLVEKLESRIAAGDIAISEKEKMLAYKDMYDANTGSIELNDAFVEMAREDKRPLTLFEIATTGAVDRLTDKIFPDTTLYGETKALAVRHLMKIAEEEKNVHVRILHPGSIIGTSADLIAERYGDTSAVAPDVVAQEAYNLLFDGSDEKLRQSIITSAEYFPWTNEGPWNGKESYLTQKLPGLSIGLIIKVPVDGMRAKTIYRK